MPDRDTAFEIEAARRLIPNADANGVVRSALELMHTALLQNFVMVGADVAFTVDFQQHIGVTPLLHDPGNGILNSALDRLFVPHPLVLAEIENTHNRNHAEIVGPTARS